MFSVFKNLNQFAGKSKWLDAVAIFCARTLAYLLVFVLLLGSFAKRDLSLLLITLLSGFASRFVITQAIYFFYKKPRPARISNSKVLIPIPTNPALPSGHASFFFGVSFMLCFYSLPLGIFFIVLSFLMGLSRVFCGVHWFTDILAGIFTGIVSSLIIYSLLVI